MPPRKRVREDKPGVGSAKRKKVASPAKKGKATMLQFWSKRKGPASATSTPPAPRTPAPAPSDPAKENVIVLSDSDSDDCMVMDVVPARNATAVPRASQNDPILSATSEVSIPTPPATLPDLPTPYEGDDTQHLQQVSPFRSVRVSRADPTTAIALSPFASLASELSSSVATVPTQEIPAFQGINSVLAVKTKRAPIETTPPATLPAAKVVNVRSERSERHRANWVEAAVAAALVCVARRAIKTTLQEAVVRTLIHADECDKVLHPSPDLSVIELQYHGADAPMADPLPATVTVLSTSSGLQLGRIPARGVPYYLSVLGTNDVVVVVFMGGWNISTGGSSALRDVALRVNLIGHEIPLVTGFAEGISHNCFVLRDEDAVMCALCPEVMISATDVSDAIQCTRRAWLSKRSRMGRGATALPALSGTLVHAVVQDLWKASMQGGTAVIPSDAAIEACLAKHVQDVCVELYFAQLSDEGMLDAVRAFIPPVKHCLAVLNKAPTTEDPFGEINPFSLSSTQMLDDEVRVACTHHGLNGIVDAVGVTGTPLTPHPVQQSALYNQPDIEDIVPNGVPVAVELKTLQHYPPRGRPFMNVQHKAQLMVYLLLLKMQGRPVKAGILAYLPKGGTHSRVISMHRDKLWREIQHVMKVRNNLAVYMRTETMPAPVFVRDKTACKYCNHAVSCVSLATVLQSPQPSDTRSFLREICPQLSHTDHRNALFQRQRSAGIQPQMQRQTSDGVDSNFSREDTFGSDDAGSAWEDVARSEQERAYLLQWHRWITAEAAEEARFGAKHNTIYAKQVGSMVELFSREDARLRQLVVSLEPPQFAPGSETTTFDNVFANPQLPPLNADQRTAIHHALCAKDYAIIQGLPGTGKTSTIASLVYFCSVVLRQRVLVVSGTNSAVDTLCHRFLDYPGLDFYRLLPSSLSYEESLGRVPAELRGKVFPDYTAAGSTVEVARLVETTRVLCTTAHNMGHPMLGKSTMSHGLCFDLVVVDEAAQLMQPVAVGALFFAPRFVLVGDHEQLPPMVRSKTAMSEGASISIMQRLATAHPHSVVTLNTQYRMNVDIATLANLITYKGRLITTCTKVQQNKLSPQILPNNMPKWLQLCLTPDPGVVFIDSTDVTELRGIGLANTNTVEANMACEAAVRLRAAGCNTVAVISPFRNQADMITKMLNNTAGVSVYTVDQAQGKDVDGVVITMGKQAGDRVGDLIRSLERINVAFTRAKKKEVCIGAFSAVFDSIPEWAPILAYARSSAGVCFERPQLSV